MRCGSRVGRLSDDARSCLYEGRSNANAWGLARASLQFPVYVQHTSFHAVVQPCVHSTASPHRPSPRINQPPSQSRTLRSTHSSRPQRTALRASACQHCSTFTGRTSTFTRMSPPLRASASTRRQSKMTRAPSPKPLRMAGLLPRVRSSSTCARSERCHRVGSPAGDVADGARAQRGAGAQGEGARARSKGDGAPAAQGHHTRSAGRAAGRAPHPSAAPGCMPPCACERSSARASLERPARVEGRPRAHPRATEAWRTGCGVAKGWAQKRAHRGGRARAEEVCTRVRGPFCQGLPQRGRPPALWGNAKACIFGLFC